MAQRCLYGVDKNPRAVELAKLSLWLATLAREHEFTFLDHALKCGDSLVGLDAVQIAAMHWDTSKPGLPLFRKFVADRVAEATKARAEIQSAPDNAKRVVLEQKNRFVEKSVEPVRALGDAVISAFFGEDKAKAREKRRATVESWVTGIGEAKWDELRAAAASLRTGEYALRPFHWAIEFPEVFVHDNPGFDALIGNPPFLGGVKISNLMGMGYFAFLTVRFVESGHLADYVAYFFRLSFSLLRKGRALGLIATNTVSQGDTREAGLAWIIENGGQIFAATKNVKWPGDATVRISVVHILRCRTRLEIHLNERPVKQITSFLLASGGNKNPARLASLEGLFSQGSNIRSPGFLFGDDGEPNSLAELELVRVEEPKSAEKVFPYLGGEEVNVDPQQRPRRFVINVNDAETESDLRQWPALEKIIREKVKPERDKLGGNPNNKKLKLKWWAFHAERRKFYSRIRKLSSVIVNSAVSPHMAFAVQPTNRIWGHVLNIFVFDTAGPFCLLQSRVHEIWARFFSSTLEDRLRYSPSDCFETFPFPIGLETSSKLEDAGRA